MTIAEAPSIPALSAQEARAALAAEWDARSPRTPDDILEFYRTSEHLAADLEAFHADPNRQEWTKSLLHVVNQVKAKLTIDIGCGLGHDLRALKDDDYDRGLFGVEPNTRMREALWLEGIPCAATIDDAPIEHADVLSCFDVLEHVPDPESFLSSIASRAKIGAILLETCATSDTETPLHLVSNRGWRTGRALERNGWEKIADRGTETRLRVWQRKAETNRLSTSLMPCTFRTVSLPTHSAIVGLMTNDPMNTRGWREFPANEAGLLRARNIAASRWWADTADDVFLMVDDDIIFEPEDAEKIVDRCREGYDIIAAAYSVRDGGHLAVRVLDGDSLDISFGQNLPPRQMRHMATGFFAVHRRVLDTMIPTLPLCHANQPWAFWPMFDFQIIEDETAGGYNHLSEDYWFCERAQQLGFKVWLDPTIKIRHQATVQISLMNMQAMAEAIKRV